MKITSSNMKWIINILKGWFSSYIYSTDKQRKLSKERLEVCNKCPYAVDKTFLKFRKDKAYHEKTKACKFCGCPIVEKSLVKDEKCHLNLWKR